MILMNYGYLCVDDLAVKENNWQTVSSLPTEKGGGEECIALSKEFMHYLI